MRRSSEAGVSGIELSPGVREIEHTADLGIEVEAASLAELFRRAAAGTMALVREEVGPDEPAAPSQRAAGERLVWLEAEDTGGLLVRWLRELLYLQEVEGFVYRDATFERLEASRLRARVRGEADPSPPVRELKAVTYHGLEVRREDGRWRARVIFDI